MKDSIQGRQPVRLGEPDKIAPIYLLPPLLTSENAAQSNRKATNRTWEDLWH